MSIDTRQRSSTTAETAHVGVFSSDSLPIDENPLLKLLRADGRSLGYIYKSKGWWGR